MNPPWSSGRVDPDDVGACVGEPRRHQRCGKPLAEVHYAQTLKRAA
jgi:hypothetical protein